MWSWWGSFTSRHMGKSIQSLGSRQSTDQGIWKMWMGLEKTEWGTRWGRKDHRGEGEAPKSQEVLGFPLREMGAMQGLWAEESHDLTQAVEGLLWLLCGNRTQGSKGRSRKTKQVACWLPWMHVAQIPCCRERSWWMVPATPSLDSPLHSCSCWDHAFPASGEH